jgi:anti-sigma B factor antagonist
LPAKDRAAGIDVSIDRTGWVWDIKAARAFFIQNGLVRQSSRSIMAQLKISNPEGVTVVGFHAKKILDEDTIRAIGSELAQVTKQTTGGRLVLDFSDVSFMSSAMLGQIMRVSKQSEANQIELKLSGISPQIMEVFRLTQLDKVLDIHKTEEDAIAAFDAPKKKGWFGR